MNNIKGLIKKKNNNIMICEDGETKKNLLNSSRQVSVGFLFI